MTELNHQNYFWYTRIHLSENFHKYWYISLMISIILKQTKSLLTLIWPLWPCLTPNYTPKEKSDFQWTTKITSGTPKYIFQKLFMNVCTISPKISMIYTQKLAKKAVPPLKLTSTRPLRRRQNFNALPKLLLEH